MELTSLISGLSDPAAYPAGVQNVELRQTHISVVFLTEEFAFKIRKPVKFSFLDFSSLEKRHFDCCREVELNQRLAPGVYLGVVPIVQREGRIHVGGGGEPVEWAVQMRRLPENATLKHQLLQDDVGADLFKVLGRRLATFHAGAACSSQIAEFAKYEAVARNVLENLNSQQANGSPASERTVQTRIAELTRQRLEEHRDLIEQRAARGVPRDTHGDLRLDHVYYFPECTPPADLCIVDCIEFNDGFRYADPVSDIAFLIMDLKFEGRSDLAQVQANEYFLVTDDSEGRQLLSFYVAYRAAVRAKVSTLESVEDEIPESERSNAIVSARAHWLLTLTELEVPSRRPCLVLVGGLQGTGKSTLARGLAEIAGFSVIRTDVVRKELAGISTEPSSDRNKRDDIYSQDWTERTYSECLRRAVELLQRGARVIVDGTFCREQYRRRFLDAAARLALPGLFLNCQADPRLIQRRLDERTGDVSDANWDVYKAAASKWDPAGKPTARTMTVIDTSQSVPDAISSAANILRQSELLEPLMEEFAK
ncbi:MAG: hypothetical protein JWM11_2621 [Planctomycetaceae bacterium]|nr:hypothetical protein [Planctomycetaceae bacterium]